MCGKMRSSKPITPDQARERIERMCLRAEYCTYDIRLRLRKMRLSAAATEEIIGRLTADRFIDDERYAHAFVRDRYRFQRYGRRRIAMELTVRRIPSDIISEAMEEIDEEEYLRIATDAIRSRKRMLGEERDPYDVRRRLFSYGLYRGYETATIKAALARIAEEEAEEAEDNDFVDGYDYPDHD